MLLVTLQYLAFDEIYHQIEAAFPGTPTLSRYYMCAAAIIITGFSPFVTSISKEIITDSTQKVSLHITIHTIQVE